MDDRAQAAEKVLLLLQRERELFALKMKHEQVALWLRLTHSLTPLFDPKLTAVEIYGRLRKALLTGLRLQRVTFVEFGPDCVQGLAPVGLPRALTAQASAFLALEPAGFCNEPSEPGVAALAELLELHRFFWAPIQVPGSPPVLLAAGFDASKARTQMAFDESAAAHVRNAAKHIEFLLSNQSLVRELEVEKTELQQVNRELEQRDEALRAAGDELRVVNEGLERRVTERTEELQHRNRDLHLVLDNVNQAFLTVDVAGRLSREHSTVSETWFGEYVEGTRFVDYIAATNARFSAHFELAFEALIDDALPREVCLDQFPRRFSSTAHEFSCHCFPVLDGEVVSGLVIVISDVTEEVRRARTEAQQAELLALFQAFTRDKTGYFTFRNEASQMLARLVDEALNADTRKRLLHTLKGNAAGMGAHLMAELCHTAESQLSGDVEGSVDDTVAQAEQRWSTILQAMRGMTESADTHGVEVPLGELAELSELVRGDSSKGVILDKLTFWQSEPAALPLSRLADGAQVLMRRLGRGRLAVGMTAADVRLNIGAWSSIWSNLVHIVRNAVDHGFESAEERLGLGKPEQPRLELRLERNEDALVIEIEDDGRGINWDLVRAAAAARGLPHANQVELEQALFASGLSTRHEVTTTSGRGVGLAAVQQQIVSLGGTIRLRSRAGAGTCWSLRLPIGERLPVHGRGR